MPQPVDDDNTVRLTRPAASGSASPRVPIWAIAAVLVVLAGAGAWLFWPPAGPPIPSQVATPPSPLTAATEAGQTPPQPNTSAPSVVVEASTATPGTGITAAVNAVPGSPRARPDRAEFSIEAATEQQILDHVPAEGAPDPTAFYFKPNPRILVLDFASLLDQGRMLNRVAALIEKSGLPHDRLLSDGELDTAIRANGDTIETFYYGHDYGALSLIRFFALADRDKIGLMAEEDRLGRLIRQAGWFQPDANAALISIPQIGANNNVTRSGRATILHHELSHGEYFTNPAYVAFVHRFWTQTLTAAERDRIRHHLRTLGYDSGLDDVMENEAQAYLMFTDSAEFFTPDMVGMSKPRLLELRTGFLRGMPAGWLRDCLNQTLTVTKAGTKP